MRSILIVITIFALGAWAYARNPVDAALSSGRAERADMVSNNLHHYFLEEWWKTQPFPMWTLLGGNPERIEVTPTWASSHEKLAHWYAQHKSVTSARAPNGQSLLFMLLLNYQDAYNYRAEHPEFSLDDLRRRLFFIFQHGAKFTELADHGAIVPALVEQGHWAAVSIMIELAVHFKQDLNERIPCTSGQALRLLEMIGATYITNEEPQLNPVLLLLARKLISLGASPDLPISGFETDTLRSTYADYRAALVEAGGERELPKVDQFIELFTPATPQCAGTFASPPTEPAPGS